MTIARAEPGRRGGARSGRRGRPVDQGFQIPPEVSHSSRSSRESLARDSLSRRGQKSASDRQVASCSRATRQASGSPSMTRVVQASRSRRRRRNARSRRVGGPSRPARRRRPRPQPAAAAIRADSVEPPVAADVLEGARIGGDPPRPAGGRRRRRGSAPGTSRRGPALVVVPGPTLATDQGGQVGQDEGLGLAAEGVVDQVSRVCGVGRPPVEARRSSPRNREGLLPVPEPVQVQRGRSCGAGTRTP